MTVALPGVKPKELDFLKGELHRFFPDARFHFFGSRVTGHYRESSDLDICIEDVSPIDLAILGNLRERLNESSLPYTVDLMDWHRIAPEFREKISSDAQTISDG